MNLAALTVVLLLVGSTSALFGSMKNVTVTGRLLCGGWHYQKAKVVLWEDDRMNRDDKLNETLSGPKGHFTVYGQTREVRHIEPYLLITHVCDEHASLNTYCTYTDRYDIPQEKVGGVYDMNEVHLRQATDRRLSSCKDGD